MGKLTSWIRIYFDEYSATRSPLAFYRSGWYIQSFACSSVYGDDYWPSQCWQQQQDILFLDPFIICHRTYQEYLTDAEYSKLMLKKNIFTFQDDTTRNELIDGPCLLSLFFDFINPNVVVGVEVLCQKLQATKFHPYQNDVDAMFTDMEQSFSKIINNESTCKSICQYTLNVLLSGPNPKFNTFIERIKDDIYLGTVFNNHMLHDNLETAARAKFKNMVGPKDAKILSLSTTVNALEWSVSATSENVKSGGRYGDGHNKNQGEKIVGVDKWSTFNKGVIIQHEGKTVWWCPSHKHKNRLFDGLYVWNKQEDHNAWFEKSKIRRPKKDKTSVATTAAPWAASKQVSLNKLTVLYHLK